jgi:alkylation response protein AidB-like acyl-CoA dehydrogenase
MADRTFLSWPFFDDEHRALAENIEQWAEREIGERCEDAGDLDEACRAFIHKHAAGGWLRYTVPAAYGGAREKLDSRSLCIIRETLARRSGLGEFMFAMQGLGSGPISQFGSEELKKKYLPRVARGKAIAAFAISEAEAGSDLTAMKTMAERKGEEYVINGQKTWISNAGIADFYVVFCRMAGGEKKFIALVVDADNPGLRVAKKIDVIAPHPLGTLRFENCRIGPDAVVGEPGKGLRVALGTLDIFRATVGAAALGFARRALDDAIVHAKERKQFGQALAEFQLIQARLAEMATRTDASALLVYRAAWNRDTGGGRTTREAAMAKLYATEAAQQTIDDAVQIFGGRGVVRGEAVERLYREIRALRIYEGTSEIQKLVIARQMLEGEEGKHASAVK